MTAIFYMSGMELYISHESKQIFEKARLRDEKEHQHVILILISEQARLCDEKVPLQNRRFSGSLEEHSYSIDTL